MTNGLDSTSKSLRIAVSVCVLFTFLSAGIFFLISMKVSDANKPLLFRIAAAEDKMKDHITTSNKCLAAITSKDFFDLTIKEINKDVVEIKISQKELSAKFDNLVTIILEEALGNPGG